MIPTTWSLDPLPLAAAAVALALYAQAFGRLRRRGRAEHASVLNAVLFTAGVAVGTLAVVSPLDELAEETLLSAHMAQHLLLGDLAPLLIVLGLRGPIAFFLLPPAVLRPLARVKALRRFLDVLLRPAVSLGVWAVTLAVWHVPQAYDAALAHPAVHVAEHACLFLGGLLLWMQIVDPTRRQRLTPGRRAAFAATALVGGMALSEVLLASAPLYAHYADAGDRPFGLTYRTDQDRAALLMMAEQIATLGPAAALLLWSHVENVERELAGRLS
ncbi:MAG TPA: cytochrome c oxidase assembly protein [Solirubrobacteraceae bacterium]|nr:cytochrome c oxidase assembly protein [Solirubrobacteraceae bacterium]